MIKPGHNYHCIYRFSSVKFIREIRRSIEIPIDFMPRKTGHQRYWDVFPSEPEGVLLGDINLTAHYASA